MPGAASSASRWASTRLSGLISVRVSGDKNWPDFLEYGCRYRSPTRRTAVGNYSTARLHIREILSDFLKWGQFPKCAQSPVSRRPETKTGVAQPPAQLASSGFLSTRCRDALPLRALKVRESFHQTALTPGRIVFVNDTLFRCDIQRADSALGPSARFRQVPFSNRRKSLFDKSARPATVISVSQTTFFIFWIPGGPGACRRFSFWRIRFIADFVFGNGLPPKTLFQLVLPGN